MSLKLFDLHKLADAIGDDSKQDQEGEASVERGAHDIHADDTEFFAEEDRTDEEKEDGSEKFWM